MQRLTAYFSGMVQGVGFRYTTYRLATKYPQVTGTVRNLPGRRVELIAEGRTENLAAFLKDIHEQMAGYIRDTTSTYAPATGQFTDFTIIHG